MTTTKPTFEDIAALLDTRYSLCYIDYRDSLDEHLEAVQKAIHNPENSALDDLMDFTWEQEADSIYEILKKLKSEVVSKFDLSDKEAEEQIDEYRDQLSDVIHDRDDSTPLDDLIQNTRDRALFYSTGVTIGDYTTSLKERLNEVKGVLQIKLRDKTYDPALEQMLCQASYGGELVIYFYDNPCNWLDWNNENKNKKITFSNFCVAVIDTMNGSGDHTEIGHSFSLPFNREMLFICKEISYSYTHEVCGMYDDWCQSTKVELQATKSKKTLEKSEICTIQNKKLEYEKAFKAGGCTPGDMDVTRHRRTTYINNYPCGTKCLDCGNFWID